VNQLFGLVDFLLGVAHNQTMKVFILVASVSSIGLSFTLLDGTFATNSDLGARIFLHRLQSVSTWTN
jgi:hypothetical protein